MLHINSVLVADDIEEECLQILKMNGVSAIKKTKLSEEQLQSELLQHDAVVVRSATKVRQ